MAEPYNPTRTIGIKLNQFDRIPKIEMINLVGGNPVHCRKRLRREEVINRGSEGTFPLVTTRQHTRNNSFIRPIGLAVVSPLGSQRFQAEQTDHLLRCEHLTLLSGAYGIDSSFLNA
jgi:hypothetical protein